MLSRSDPSAAGSRRFGFVWLVLDLELRGGTEGNSSEITTSRSPPARRMGRTRSPPLRASSRADVTAVWPVLQLTTRLRPTSVSPTSANRTPQRLQYAAASASGATDTDT